MPRKSKMLNCPKKKDAFCKKGSEGNNPKPVQDCPLDPKTCGFCMAMTTC